LKMAKSECFVAIERNNMSQSKQKGKWKILRKSWSVSFVRKNSIEWRRQRITSTWRTWIISGIWIGFPHILGALLHLHFYIRNWRMTQPPTQYNIAGYMTLVQVTFNLFNIV
jgi:hypothetical protein